MCACKCEDNPWENKWSPWAHNELTVSSRWPRWSRLWGPMITAESQLREVTAQSRRGHSSVTARSQLSHGEVRAQSRHLQYDHGSVTARPQLNHGPWSPWAHGELTMSSRWAVTVANFFSWECSTSQTSVNGWHSIDRDQKLTREARNELVHQISGQSNYQFLVKCAKTKFEIKGVVGPEEHGNHNKGPDGLTSSAA